MDHAVIFCLYFVILKICLVVFYQSGLICDENNMELQNEHVLGQKKIIPQSMWFWAKKSIGGL